MESVKALAAWPCGRRSKWVVLVVWVIVFMGAGALAQKLGDVQNNEMSSWLPGNAESTKVIEQQKLFQDSTIAPAVVVYERPGGLTAEDRTRIEADAKQFGAVQHVLPGAQIVPQYDANPQSAAAQTVVPITVKDGGWMDLGESVKDIRKVTGKDVGGMKVYTTGPAGIATDQSEAFAGIDGRLLFAAIGVVVVILLLTYRSPFLWLLPLLSSVVALTAAQGVVYLFAKQDWLLVNGQSQAILTILVFGASTDYALLLVSRYREELHRYEDKHEAMRHALERSGPAILASAATVAVGMLCLMAADMNSTESLGPVCALGVAVGLIAMLTLLPALLVIVDRWAFWPKKPVFDNDPHDGEGMWARIGDGIARRPRIVWIATAVALGVLALGALGLKPEIMESKDTFIDKPESISGQEVAGKYFPAGTGSPVEVIGKASAAGPLKQTFERVEGISSVGEPQIKGELVRLEGVLKDPADSEAARNTVERVREAVHQVTGADANTGGDTAVGIDIEAAADHDDKLIIPMTLVAVLIILMLLLRALFSPILLMLTVVLSFAASMGVSVLVFEHIFGFAGVGPGFPLFVFVFLVALGVDYNIFLMSRVREEAAKHGTRRGSLIGLAATGGVITSAGLVLAGTFAALGTLPIVDLAELGFAVAFGILLDTMIVRSILVTALNLDIGSRIWWPHALAKHPDEEGAVPAPRSADAEGERTKVL